MKITNKTSIIALYILTVVSALVSVWLYDWKLFFLVILLLSVVKFILVTFQFMEMKKAHSFWKYLIVIYLLIFVGVVSIILL